MTDEYKDELDPVFVPDTTRYVFNPKSTVCHFNNSVDCTDKKRCPKCGWNPAVAEIRAREIRRRLAREK